MAAGLLLIAGGCVSSNVDEAPPPASAAAAKADLTPPPEAASNGPNRESGLRKDPSADGVAADAHPRQDAPAAVFAVPSISVSDGDWGDAKSFDIASILRSTAQCFDAAAEERAVDSVSVEPSPAGEDYPSTLFEAADGKTQIRLSARGRHWAQFAFQFGHEFCHVLSNHRVMADRPFGWINECLCETASLYALRSMARTWEASPPYPELRDYAPSLRRYADDRCAKPEHSLPQGVAFTAWLAAHLPSLSADPDRHADVVVIAKQLLPVFEQRPDAWRAVRYLNLWNTQKVSSIADYFEQWRTAAPARFRGDIDRIERALASDD